MAASSFFPTNLILNNFNLWNDEKRYFLDPQLPVGDSSQNVGFQVDVFEYDPFDSHWALSVP